MVAQTATTTSGTLMRNATRHEIVSTRMPPMNGPRIVVAAVAAAHTPYARPWASPLKFAVGSATVTTDESTNTIDDPSTAAISVQRARLFTSAPPPRWRLAAYSRAARGDKPTSGRSGRRGDTRN